MSGERLHRWNWNHCLSTQQKQCSDPPPHKGPLLFVKYICSLFTKAFCHVDLKWVIRAAGVDIWHQKEMNIRFRPVLNAFDISEQQFSSIMDWWTLTTNAHSLGKWENVSLEAALAATSFLNGFWWLDGQMFAESKWLCQARTDSWRF